MAAPGVSLLGLVMTVSLMTLAMDDDHHGGWKYA